MDLKTYINEGERGRATKLAHELGVSPSYLSQMASGASAVSLDRCVPIEKATNGAVTCEELRPDKADYWAYLRASIQSTNPDSPALPANERETKGPRKVLDMKRVMT